MANDPTDLTKYPLGSTSFIPAARNASDFDELINGGNTTVINRTGKVLDSYERSLATARENYGDINIRGDYTGATAYALRDVVKDSSDGTWYITVEAFTSTNISSDIASGYLKVWQGLNRETGVVRVDSIADLISFDVYDGALVYVIGYHSGKTYGGGVFYWDSTETADGDGYGIIEIAGKSGRWVRVDMYPVTLEKFGATGSGDEYLIVQQCINYCYSNNIKIVEFSRDIQINGLIGNRQEVTFIAKNGAKFTGDSTYKLRWFAEGTPTSLPVFGISASQVPAMSRSSVNFVVVGDSLSTRSPNAVDRSDTFYSALVSKVKDDNIDANITFYNRAVGGMSWPNLDSVATSNFPDWYDDTGKAWLDYVEELNPDVVVIAMGMNGSSASQSPSYIRSVYNKIKAFASNPDVIFVSTPVPSTEPGSTYYNDFATYGQQELRNFTGGLTWHFARYHNVPCIDINRQCNLIRDGFDIRNTYAEVYPDAALVNGAWVPDILVRNFSATLILNDNSAYSSTNQLSVKVGSDNTEVVFIQEDAGDLKLSFFDAAGVNYNVITITGHTIPTGAHTLRVEVYDGTFKAYIPGVAEDTVMDPVPMIVGGDLYSPKIGTYQDSWASGELDGITATIGRHIQYIPTITNNELWGVPDGTSGTKTPFGGNGINHPTSIGFRKLYADVINQCDFSAENINTRVVSGNTYIDYKGGQIVAMGGRVTLGSTGAQVDSNVTWPVSLDGFGVTSMRLTHSSGVAATDLDAAGARGAQTIVTFGLPSVFGVECTVHSLTETGLGRFFDWRLDVGY